MEQLIEYVTAEVFKCIEAPQKENLPKKKVLIIGEEDEIRFQSKEILALDYEVETTCDYKGTGDYDYIVLTQIDTDFLASAAIGMLGGNYPLIQKALMEGTPIHMIEEGIIHRKYAGSCNPNFYALLCAYEEKLESFGMLIKPLEALCGSKDKVSKPEKIEVVQEVQAVEEVEEVEKTAEVPEVDCAKVTVIDKKLITEQQLRRAQSTGNMTIQVRKDAIITPLAGDYAREHKMTIEKM